MVRNEKNPRKTREWREAENWYSQLFASPVFSIMGGGLMPPPETEDIIQELENILVICPLYFPAWFYRGEYMLRIGRDSEGEKFLEKGFDCMVRVLEDEEEFERELGKRMENLEKLLRYDLTVKYMEKAIRIFPETASYYDDLAFYILQLPDREKSEALRMQEKALHLEPDNDYFINNLGWVYLMMGNYRNAEMYFLKALKFNIDNPNALKNLDTAEYMHENRLSYFEYLVRPADISKIKKLLENIDFEGAAELCREYNADRVDAFKMNGLQKKVLPPHEILNIIQPFQFFINEVGKMVDDEILLYENIDLFLIRFRSFLYDFIINTEFIEEQLLEEINRSISFFYNFLRETHLITIDQNKRFIGHISSLINEFSSKIEDYSRIRHDIHLEKSEREKAIEELFGMHYIRE